MSKEKFMCGVVQYLQANHKRQNVHVWINGAYYLGLWVWGYCLHTPWGASRRDVEQAQREGSITINLVYTGA